MEPLEPWLNPPLIMLDDWYMYMVYLYVIYMCVHPEGLRLCNHVETNTKWYTTDLDYMYIASAI